ncbi:MAG: tetratricopeptide repeat protein [Brumimicrobium sp.]|nr:tetratricopeptide repeat protein [Brumimicrobium sp.]MCO5269737.1 tetratricopeptide repeat protein [Brumimicrobium sp.]
MKVYYIAYIILILTLLSCNGVDKSKDNEQFYTTQDSLTDEDRLKMLNDSLGKYPNDIKLWLAKGELCKKNLDFKCALDAGARSFKLDSTNLQARELYAWTLINKPNAPLSDIETAQRHYEYILSISPKNPQVLVDLANTYSLTGDFKTAFKYINDALRIDERYRDAYVLKGSIYRVMEKYDLALSSYQTALQMDPNFFMGQLETGWLLTQMEKHDLALEYYQNAVELQPNNINAIYGVAKSYQDLANYDEALFHYRKLAKVSPKFYITFFNQAFIKQYHQNQLDSAAYYYDKAIRIFPEYKEAWYQLGEVYLAQKRTTDAARAFSESLHIDPHFEPALDGAKRLKNFKYE